MLDSLLPQIAPHSCCGCGNVGQILCVICKNDIVSDPFSNCLLCLAPTPDGDLCVSCRNASRLEGAWCAGTREGHLRTLLDKYKFDSSREAAVICVELLDGCLPLLPAGVVVTAVPTAPAHLRVRGFDHTAAIAKRFAARRKLRFMAILSKTSSGTQHFRTRKERERLATESLKVTKQVPKDVVLIDDIYTTGATVRACVEKLTEAGAQRVFVAIIARQTLDVAADL